MNESDDMSQCLVSYRALWAQAVASMPTSVYILINDTIALKPVSH